MNRKEFERLSFKQKLDYVNARSQMTLKQIAQEIDIPASTLSKIFAEAKYERVKGVYVKHPQLDVSHSTDFINEELQELLKYKEPLLNLLKEKQNQSLNELDFTILNCYSENKRVVSLELPSEQVEEINNFIKRTGLKKQLIFSMAIYQFIQNYG